MATLCAWASISEKGTINGTKGDQKQTTAIDMKGEVRLGYWYNFKQTTVFRWNDRNYARAFAVIIQDICNNPHVGYGQNDRTSLFFALRDLNWDWKKLTKDVNVDCSELIVCVINCMFKKELISRTTTTSTMNNALKATGLFTILTDKKYLTSGDYLWTGDICNAPGHHVIGVLEDGKNTRLSTSVTATTDGLEYNSKLVGNYITKGTTTVYADGTINSSIITNLAPSTVVQSYGYYKGEWAFVKYGNIVGYIHGNNLTRTV